MLDVVTVEDKNGLCLWSLYDNSKSENVGFSFVVEMLRVEISSDTLWARYCRKSSSTVNPRKYNEIFSNKQESKRWLKSKISP